ncbi:MAG: ATP-binding protein [Deltaproteobacteria bacterium]|nr:ATP-binding protein [Deltaproteobacteria bacterium]MCX5837204.1 ATP-binding protein [Deltaproteobacteria bacterium]
MTKNRMLSENTTPRLRWLMLSRVAIVTFLLGIATFVDVKGMETISTISASTLFKTILLTYILSIVYLFLLKYVRNLLWNIYIQSLCDVILITGMVYATGGIHSIYSVFYPLVIIYSVLFLGRRGGLVIASAAGIFYGLFVDLEFYGVIYPVFSTPVQDYFPNAAYVFMRIIIHILSFYFIAFLTSFVVEQEKKTRTLLAEKQNAFAQLDLLHRSIIESVDTGILTVNLGGQIKSFNRAAAEITGFLFREVENRIISDVFPNFPPLPKEKNPDGYRQTARIRFETTFNSGDGRSLSLGGSLSPLRDPRGLTIGNIIVFQDLTEINEMRESLEKSRRLAFIGEMAAGLAHEIRNPLASMSGSIQMLSQDLSHSETHRKLMQIILRGKDQLESFLKDFLLMARPAPGVREEIDLRDMIMDILDSLHFVPDWHEPVQIDLHLKDDPLSIHANRTESRQVLWNVILNAIQAMPDGGALTVEAHGRRNDERDGVEIRIHDTGCGIKKNRLQKIFEPFYTTRDTGTGLGLAVVSRILEEYNGKIDIQSEEGKGTACTIWLPCRIFPADGNRIIS